MRFAISRWTVVGALGLSVLISAASGCRSGTTAGSWSTPSWMSMSNWGWGGSSSSPTSLAQNKPSTSVPKPSTTATPQAVASVGAGSGQQYATNPNYAHSGAHGTQTAAAYQPAGGANQVQPTVGYQTGPYGMSSATSGPGGYAAAGYGAV